MINLPSSWDDEGDAFARFPLCRACGWPCPPDTGFAIPTSSFPRTVMWFHLERYCVAEDGGVLDIYSWGRFARGRDGTVRPCEDLPDIAAYEEAS